MELAIDTLSCKCKSSTCMAVGCSVVDMHISTCVLVHTWQMCTMGLQYSWPAPKQWGHVNIKRMEGGSTRRIEVRLGIQISPHYGN